VKTIKNSSGNWDRSSFIKILKYGGVIIGSIVLICLLIFILFTDYFINSFFKDKIDKALKDSYPAYKIEYSDMHYSVWENSLVIDSLKIDARDSSISAGASSVSVGGIGWIKTIWNGSLDSSNIKNLEFNIEDIAVDFYKEQKTLRAGTLHISVPDSEIISDSIKYYPSIADERFFANSNFKQTRFNINIPKIDITSIDFPALFQGTAYKVGSINIHDMLTDILVNMDKPNDLNSANPQMPVQALSSIKEIIQIENLNIINGRLKYSERFKVGAKPGVITFNKVNISVIGIVNHTISPDTLFITGEGLFMNSSTMKLSMEIPLTPNDFSFQYSGSLGQMDATTLNSFIEAGEHQRVKSGAVQSAAFNINVNSGQATGTLRVAYRDLSIAILDKETGSEKGIFKRILSFVGKVFVIRDSNMPDENGLMKIGSIIYTHKPGEPFFQFIWFALRSGIGDVVGFPPEVAAAN
jgi:hypothetical protein